MLDVESFAFTHDMYQECLSNGEVFPRLFFQRMALNITLMICYGTRFADIRDPMLLNMLNAAETVSTYVKTCACNALCC